MLPFCRFRPDDYIIMNQQGLYFQCCRSCAVVLLISYTEFMDTITHTLVESYVLSMPDAKLGYPFGESVAVYTVDSKMFALIDEGSEPVRISLKCDPKLAEVLRDKYESVLPGYHLNKKHWNTLILSGQLNWEEVQDLIRHSYQLITNEQM